MKITAAAVLAFMLFATAVHADFYSWTDKDGEEHLVGKIEDVPKEYRSKAKVRRSLYKDDAAQSLAPDKNQGASSGVLYYWKDAFGRRHIVNSLDKVPNEYRGSVEKRIPLAPEGKAKTTSRTKETTQAPTEAEGDMIYTWTDKDGNVHITDSMDAVPVRYRSKVKARKAAEPQPSNVNEAPKTGAQPDNQVELYGDHPLDWWKETFRKLKNDIGALEASIMSKENYIKLMESGIRLGQLYEPKDVDTYEQYRKELPENEARLDSLNSDREELRRKARIVGVPKTLWDN